MDLVSEALAQVRIRLLEDVGLMSFIDAYGGLPTDSVSGGIYEETTFMPEEVKLFPRIHIGVEVINDALVEQKSVDDIIVSINHFTKDTSILRCSEMEALTRNLLEDWNICTNDIKVLRIIRDEPFWFKEKDEKTNTWRILTRYKLIKGALKNG